MPALEKRNDPVLFYYNPIKKSGDVVYINLILVIQDKISGKLLPEQYVTVAEKSAKRIEKLNRFALEKVKTDIEKNPDKIFIVYLSPRFLKKDNLGKTLRAVAQKENNVIFALNGVLLNAMGEKGKAGITALREKGVRVMLDGIEHCSLKNLDSTEADFIRLDARLYDDKNSMLTLIQSFCKEKNIQIIAKNVDTKEEADYFLKSGVELLEGRAIERPKRYLKNLFRT